MAAGRLRRLGFDPPHPPAARVIEAVGGADPGEEDVPGPQLVGDAVEFGFYLAFEEEVSLLEGVIVSLRGTARS